MTTVPGTDVELDEGTAVVVVDVQNDFADPAGGLYVQGGEETVPVINRLVAAARDADALVVYTQDWHPPSTPHFADEGGTWPVHCVEGTWGAELHPDLDVSGPVFRKGTGDGDGYSGFATRDLDTGEDVDTGLKAVLDERAVRHVVVVGLAHDVCVKATALDARRHGFDTTVWRGATRAVEVELGDAARADEELTAAGVRLV